MSLTPQEIQYYKEHANDSLQPSIISSNAIGLGLAYIFVGLRVWARKKTKTQFGCDDWLIIAALAPLTTYAIVGWLQVSFGEGKHIIFVTNRAGFIQGYVTCIVAYAICVVLTKLSILCFYCRIFVPFKSLLYISWGFGIFIVAYNLALIFVAAFQCIPLSSMWTGRPGTCIDTLPPYTALGIVNVVADVAILALPIRYIFTLHLNMARRIQICAIFLLGGLVCVFGIVRVTALATAGKGDPSYNQVWSGVWSFCEIAIGIVAACLPTLAVFATKSHFSKIQASAIHLLSITFRRSRGSSRSNTRSTHTTNDSRGQEGDYSQLSEWSPPRTAAGENGTVTPFVASNAVERGEKSEENLNGIKVENEVTQTIS